MPSPYRFDPAHHAAIDGELAHIEAYLEGLVGEINALAPVLDKRGHLWRRTTAAQESVQILRWDLAQHQRLYPWV